MEKSYIIMVVEPIKKLKPKQKPNFFIEVIKLNESNEEEEKESLLQYRRRTSKKI